MTALYYYFEVLLEEDFSVHVTELVLFSPSLIIKAELLLDWNFGALEGEEDDSL